MDSQKSVPVFSIILFSLVFILISSFLLGEFFFGKAITLLKGGLILPSFTLIVVTLVACLHAQATFLGKVSKNFSEMFLFFPIIFVQKGPIQLLAKNPLKNAIGLSFSLSMTIVITVSGYYYWPRITSKFAFQRKLTEKEQVFEDYRIVKRMLKSYKNLYKKYPLAGHLVEQLQIAKNHSQRIKESLKHLKLKKNHLSWEILDPWGIPYIYQPYQKFKVWKTYRFYSTNMHFSK